MSGRAIIRSEFSATKFGIFTDDVKKLLSVVSVTSSQTFDEAKNHIDGGLYDLAMGPLEQAHQCRTCNMGFASCPGHLGHVELDFPVYYPVYFSDMVKLLRAKCVFCHRLRLSAHRIRIFLIRLKLLEMGEILEAEQIVDAVAPQQFFLDGEAGGPDKANEDHDPSVDIERRLSDIEKRYTRFVKRNKNSNHVPDQYVKSLQQEIIDQCMKACLAAKKCETCSAFSPPFRKDGNTKIFQRPIPKRNRRSMEGMNLKHRTALTALKQGDDNEDDSDDNILDEAIESDREESDSDDDDNNEATTAADKKKKDANKEADKYLTSMEVEAQLQLLWQKSPELLNFIWTRSLGVGLDIDLTSTDAWRVFFTRIVLIPPNKFRPAAFIAGLMSDNPQNKHLKTIIAENSKLRLLHNETAQQGKDDMSLGTAESLSKMVTGLIALQTAVNSFMDSSKSTQRDAPPGIRQLLERKEGLFRRNMMGKRVNYCCRSVISPDPYLGTNEVGIPVHFAKELHYPVPVNDRNLPYLRKLVERGPDQYPGANQIEMADGKIIKLQQLSAIERTGKAKLLSTKGMKVYRHLIDGDALLVNRQPSLHKASIMAHRARVLQHVKEQTLRLHYANCNSYNADFDGDEMNCHFVQNELARSEAYNICNTDNQYIIPTSGNPIRGLIQDHVTAAVKMTCKDTFLNKAQYQQLVYVALNGLTGTEIVSAYETIITPEPAILKPVARWTGKQVISAILSHLCRKPLPALQLDFKAKTPATAMGPEQSEHEIVIRAGELLQGVLDKSAIGAASLGLVHAIYELYGPELASRLLNSFARLFTFHLQTAGHSCGIEDLVLKTKADAERVSLLHAVNKSAKEGLVSFLQQHNQTSTGTTNRDLRHRLGLFMSESSSGDPSNSRRDAKVQLDGAMQQVVNQSASSVIKACLPFGLRSSFLYNHFALMVTTGAKGSTVNQSQISCFLGQQALEGQRVPIMASGKSLPSFAAFDGSARAGGFVSDRFLTGVKPQEYYFHCMAGREGLVDTAVKTSRSGYLQRCLVKHLEELNIAYDHTVRDAGGNVVQFLYGEDGIDPVHNALLQGRHNQFLFLARNHRALAYKFSLTASFFQQGLEMDQAQHYHGLVGKAKTLVDDQALKLRRNGSKAAAIIPFMMNNLQQGAVVQARRKKDVDLPWNRSNLQVGWHTAEILRVREKPEKWQFPRLDLAYLDGYVEKKVPLALLIQPLPGSAGAVHGATVNELPFPLVRPGLPDPIMSVLRLNSSVGACSERLQACLQYYSEADPDGVFALNKAHPDAASGVAEDALELLLWVKYMRSLAAPGEAVGCVAAQSVGEPSTQMTLNTFHLAGHGGANVTLGIPRLREILMTASKKPKTPTMLLPLPRGADNNTKATAQALARSLSRVTLSELLHYDAGGVQVGEQIVQASHFSRWERRYRLRLQLLPLPMLQKAFQVTSDEIVKTVETLFLQKLNRLLKTEQRRAGEPTSGKNDPLKNFRGKKASAEEDGGGRTAGSGNNGSDNEGEGDEEGGGAARASKGSKRRRGAAGDDSNETDEPNLAAMLDDDGDNPRNCQAGHQTGEDSESEDEEGDDADDNDSDAEVNASASKGKAKTKKVIGGNYDDEEEDEDDAEVDSDDIDEDDGDDIDALVATLREEDNHLLQKDASSSSKQAGKSGKGSSSKGKASNDYNIDKGNAGQHSVYYHHNEQPGKEEHYVQVTLFMPATSRRILMAQLAERAAEQTTLRATRNITKAYGIQMSEKESGGGFAVQTEGVNLLAAWAMPDTAVNHAELQCNDIFQLLKNYGVEAARRGLVSEIQAVFAVYGIDVNARHLSLIADYMTRNGGYLPMNRNGMAQQSSSPFLQMSFETTINFLTKAVQEGLRDNQRSSSARIVAGSVPKVGTGTFELLMPLANSANSSSSYRK